MIPLPMLDDKPALEHIPALPANPAPHHSQRRWAQTPWNHEHPCWIALDVDLEDDHLVRLIDLAVSRLDLQPLYDTYSGRGSLACSPTLLLKLVLFEYARGRTSPEQWLLDINESKPVSWLLLGLRPSRSTLYDFRDRVAPFLDAFNRQVLHTAIAEGYTTACAAALDGTFMRARASRHHLLGETGLRRRCRLLEQALAEDDATCASKVRLSRWGCWCLLLVVALSTTPHLSAAVGSGEPLSPAQLCRLLLPPRLYPRWLAGTPQGRRQQLVGLRRALRRWRAKNNRHQAKQSQRAKKRRQSSAAVKVCLSEPEAALGRDKRKTFCPVYNVQLLRDLDSAFILGYGTFTAVNDSNLLPVMLQRTERLVGWMPVELLVDGAYPSGVDLAYCDSNGIRVYAPLGCDTQKQGSKGSASAAPAAQKYGKEKFSYDAERDEYVCPAGQRLRKRCQRVRRRGGEQPVKRVEYRLEAVVCCGCEQRERCTKSGSGRTISRSEHEGLLEQLRQRMSTAVGQSTYRFRKQTVELALAQLKKLLHGDEPLSSYGKSRARTQVGLAVLLLNILHLLKARHRAGKQPATAFTTL